MTDIGDVIATRKYQQDRKSVILRIGRPVVEDEVWLCPWSIDGIDEPTVIRTGGIDSLQALTLAIDMIRARLEAETGLSWEHGQQLF